MQHWPRQGQHVAQRLNKLRMVCYLIQNICESEYLSDKWRAEKAEANLKKANALIAKMKRAAATKGTKGKGLFVSKSGAHPSIIQMMLQKMTMSLKQRITSLTRMRILSLLSRYVTIVLVNVMPFSLGHRLRP
jgi:hypothetical protein